MDDHEHHHPGVAILSKMRAGEPPIVQPAAMPMAMPRNGSHEAGHKSPPDQSHATSGSAGHSEPGSGMPTTCQTRRWPRHCATKAINAGGADAAAMCDEHVDLFYENAR